MKTRSSVYIFAACLAAAPHLFSQSLSGTVVGADTGAPIQGATVVAVQATTSTAEKPVVYQSSLGAGGGFTMTASPGTYWICVGGADLYLDPCTWGGAQSVTVSAAGASSVSLKLAKGGRFLLRVRDPQQFLQQLSTRYNQGIAVWVTGAPAGQFPLPQISQESGITYYGGLLPINVPLSVSVSSGHVSFTDQTGAAISSQGIGFQVADLAAQAAALRSAFSAMFPPPQATVVDVVAAGIQ